MLTKKEARMLAYNFVMEGKRCFADLTEEDKEKIAGSIIESSYEMESWEYITEADVKSALPKMLSEYLKDKHKNGNSILELMANNAVKYCYRQIEEIMDEQEQEYLFNLKYENQ